MIEEWKEIPGLPHYQASNLGNIRTMRAGRGCREEVGHVMSGCKDEKGYLLVNCRVDGRSQTQRVHRLIARAFLGEIPPGHQINHLNGKKSDNRLENLEICSPGQNLKHRHEVLKIKINWRGSKHGLSKLDEKSVRQIRKRYEAGELQTALAKEYGVSSTTIGCVLKRKTWTHI
jgi:HNH endonuclease/NUMOD4 motif-containing protein